MLERSHHPESSNSGELRLAKLELWRNPEPGTLPRGGNCLGGNSQGASDLGVSWRCPRVTCRIENVFR